MNEKSESEESGEDLEELRKVDILYHCPETNGVKEAVKEDLFEDFVFYVEEMSILDPLKHSICFHDSDIELFSKGETQVTFTSHYLHFACGHGRTNVCVNSFLRPFFFQNSFFGIIDGQVFIREERGDSE